ncbi:MAG: HAMP domain-containing protein, partial [Elusimicrobia bacterium]|nr:HAMP domain-containing protein [Elusimicrobiota bacterium]
MRLFPKLLLLLGVCSGLPLAILGGAAVWRSRALRSELLGSSARTGEAGAAAGQKALFEESRRLHEHVVARRAAELEDFFEQGRKVVGFAAAQAGRSLTEPADPLGPPTWSDDQMAAKMRDPDFRDTTLRRKPYGVYHLAPGAEAAVVGEPLARLGRLGDYFAYAARENPWVKSVYVGDSRGFLLGYPGGEPFPPDYDPRARDWYKKGLSKGRVTWSTIYPDKDGKPVITVADPYFVGGKAAGVAGVDVSLADFLDQLFDLRDLPATDALLVNYLGEVRISAAVGPDGKFAYKSQRPQDSPHVRDFEGGLFLPAFAAVQTRPSGTLVVGDNLLSYARVYIRTRKGGKDWYYLVRTPVSRILGPALEVRGKLDSLQHHLSGVISGETRALAAQLGAAALLAALFAVGAAWFGAHAVSRPLAELSETVRRIGKGDLEARVAVTGRDEVAEVGRAVNEMAKGLK